MQDHASLTRKKECSKNKELKNIRTPQSAYPEHPSFAQQCFDEDLMLNTDSFRGKS